MPIKQTPGCQGCKHLDTSPNVHPCASCHRCWDYATQDNHEPNIVVGLDGIARNIIYADDGSVISRTEVRNDAR